MSGHGHSHGGGCGGNHDCDEHMTEEQLAAAYSLYTKINMDAVQCLNTDNPAKCVFKPWEQRLDKEKVEQFVNNNNNKGVKGRHVHALHGLNLRF